MWITKIEGFKWASTVYWKVPVVLKAGSPRLRTLLEGASVTSLVRGDRVWLVEES